MKSSTATIIPEISAEINKYNTIHGKLAVLFKQKILNQLAKIEYGHLIVNDGHHQYHFVGESNQFQVKATINILDTQFYSMLALGGSIGAGESFMLGQWYSDNLTNVIRIMVRNMGLLNEMEQGWARLGAPVRKALHWLNRNTMKGSKTNIAAHYDLGNDFFELFLDPTMMYSSGIFETDQSTMEQASIAKLKRICDKLALRESDHVLEIGTG